MAGNYWLVKCEPHETSFDDLKKRPKSTGYWRGVRNYQARNFIRDGMEKGDLAFFYHSNCDEPGIAGVVTISEPGYPDPSQFDENHKYFDEKSKRRSPVVFLRRQMETEAQDLRAPEGSQGESEVAGNAGRAARAAPVDSAGDGKGVEGRVQNGWRLGRRTAVLTPLRAP